MAEFEGTVKKRKISAIFKKKNKENKEKLEDGTAVLDVKETDDKYVHDAGAEKKVDNVDTDDESHLRKKKKFGHQRFRSSRKDKTKKQREEDKTGHIEADEKQFVQEKGDGDSEKDSADKSEKVQNVQLKCEAQETIAQSDHKESTVEIMAVDANEDNKQSRDTTNTAAEESKDNKEGSVIRSLVGNDITSEGSIPTDQHHEYTSVSTRYEECDKKSGPEDVGKITPNIFMTSFLDMVMPGSKSKKTGCPPNTTEAVYKLVLHTADKTYTTLVSLINAFLAKAGQIPKQILVNFVVYLIKKYPQCFKIKKIKRRTILADGDKISGQVRAVDTVR